MSQFLSGPLVARATAPTPNPPALSAAAEGRLFFSGTRWRVSENGGAYSDLTSPATAGGWTDAGAVVALTTVGDGVGIGTAAPALSSRLEVLGDSTRKHILVTGGAGVGVDQDGGGVTITPGARTGAGAYGQVGIGGGSSLGSGYIVHIQPPDGTGPFSPVGGSVLVIGATATAGNDAGSSDIYGGAAAAGQAAGTARLEGGQAQGAGSSAGEAAVRGGFGNTFADGGQATVRGGPSDAVGGTGGEAVVQGGEVTEAGAIGGAVRVQGGESPDGTGGAVQIIGGPTTTGTPGTVSIAGAPGGTTTGGSLVSITGGAATATGEQGGAVTITGGGSIGATGGAVTITGGEPSGGTTADGGAVNIFGGDGDDDGTGGAVNIEAGAGEDDSDGTGGDVNISGGSASDGEGDSAAGNVSISTSAGSGTGASGTITISSSGDASLSGDSVTVAPSAAGTLTLCDVDTNGLAFFGTGGSAQQGVGALTDNSGGTADDTIVAAGVVYSQADENDFRASITSKMNELISALQGYGLIA